MINEQEALMLALEEQGSSLKKLAYELNVTYTTLYGAIKTDALDKYREDISKIIGYNYWEETHFRYNTYLKNKCYAVDRRVLREYFSLLSRSNLQSALKVSSFKIDRLLSGDVKPTIREMLRICETFNISINKITLEPEKKIRSNFESKQFISFKNVHGKWYMYNIDREVRKRKSSLEGIVIGRETSWENLY